MHLGILRSSGDGSLERPLRVADSMHAPDVATPFVELFSQNFARVHHLAMLAGPECEARYHDEVGASVLW